MPLGLWVSQGGPAAACCWCRRPLCVNSCSCMCPWPASPGGRGRGGGAGVVATAGAPVLHSGVPSCVSASQAWGWREHVLPDAGEALPCRQIRTGSQVGLGAPSCPWADVSLCPCCRSSLFTSLLRGGERGQGPHAGQVALSPASAVGVTVGLSGHRPPCAPCPPASHAFSRSLCYQLALPVLSRLLTVPARELVWICTSGQVCFLTKGAAERASQRSAPWRESPAQSPGDH